LVRHSRSQKLKLTAETQRNAARQAATKEMLKPDLPKRLAALREKGSVKISFRFEKNLTVSSAEEHWDADLRGSNEVLLPSHGLLKPQPN
jgi:hypothetical protein